MACKHLDLRLALAGTFAVLLLVLVWHMTTHRQVLEVDTEKAYSPIPKDRSTSEDSWSVPPHPVTMDSTSNHLEHSAATTRGPLSMHLVSIPFLRYNTSDDLIMKRENEYKVVLQRNLNHNLVHRVHVLTTDARETTRRFSELTNKDKLVVSEVKSIDLMRDPLEYISQHLVGKDVMFANADIYLAGGFDRVDPQAMAQRKIMYTPSRRIAEDDRCNRHTVKSMSDIDMCFGHKYIGAHDAFLFRLQEPLPEAVLSELEFDLVSPGMENVLMWLFKTKLNYCLLNPCSILETFHLHCSNLRNKVGKPRVNVGGKSAVAPITTNMVC